MSSVFRGDILLYYNPPSMINKIIVVGEELEDGKQEREYYHVAIALDDKQKIETQAVEVWLRDIDYTESFDIMRLPLSDDQIFNGLKYIIGMKGQKYDWTLILDDILRYATHNIIHLPKSWVAEEEDHEKICSTLVQCYMSKAGWKVDNKFDSPEDIYLLGKNFIIHR